jgi:iron complex outermembrane recepter protein
MSKSQKARKRAVFISFPIMTAGMFACVGNSQAQQIAQDAVPETVVITGTLFNPDVAPAKASVNTEEPQTVITKSYIEDSIVPTADYVTILAITPSLTGQDISGPGLSDGSVKNTLRGLPDGMFGMTFDGIPFGDTNGPSHHSVSYFPGSAIGAIEVERGPGNAGNLGAGTYGGSINLYSEPLIDNMRAKAQATYGSWNTIQEVLNFQTGSIPELNNTRLLINFDNLDSDGALTDQHIDKKNVLLKIEDEIAPNWVLTVFGNYESLLEKLDDNNGATPAQVATFGKNFALQNTDRSLPTFIDYNWTNKYTDLDYVRLRGDADVFKIDNEAYTYAYVNHTFSPRSILQTITDINNHTAEGLGTIVNGVKQPADVPGYEKLNEYRVWGDTFRVNTDYDFGWLTGQVRAGVWLEAAATERVHNDYDITLCNQQGINPWKAIATTCEDSSLFPKSAKLLTPAQTGQANLNYAGYSEFVEHSGWDQEEPFVEVDIMPIPELTITPGYKWVNWVHRENAPLTPKLLAPLNTHFTTERSLPFLEANYKIMPNWSVYAQYAQGIYVPDISSFEVKNTVSEFPKAETTTNYQVGSVYYADNFTIDGDFYYIPINNNIVSVPCQQVGGVIGDTCFVNTGQALYKGVEGETTYAFTNGVMGGLLNGLVVFANGSINSGKSNGLYVKQASTWTAASGLIYKMAPWKFSLIAKGVGPQYSDNSDIQFYKVHAYSNLDTSISYALGWFEVSVSVNNVLGTRSILAITENDPTPPLPRLSSTDQYYFQPARSVFITLKAVVQ